MGHVVTYGHFSRVAGFTNLLCETPAVGGSASRGDLPATRALVPVEGPAVFGFDFLTEEEVIAALLASRPYVPQSLRLEAREEDAVEVPVASPWSTHDPDNDDCSCRDCVPF